MRTFYTLLLVSSVAALNAGLATAQDVNLPGTLSEKPASTTSAPLASRQLGAAQRTEYASEVAKFSAEQKDRSALSGSLNNKELSDSSFRSGNFSSNFAEFSGGVSDKQFSAPKAQAGTLSGGQAPIDTPLMLGVSSGKGNSSFSDQPLANRPLGAR